MKWTREPPTAEGWYWVFNRDLDDEPVTARVQKDGDGDITVAVHLSEYFDSIDDWSLSGAFWMGPIEVPAAPSARSDPSSAPTC